MLLKAAARVDLAVVLAGVVDPAAAVVVEAEAAVVEDAVVAVVLGAEALAAALLKRAESTMSPLALRPRISSMKLPTLRR